MKKDSRIQLKSHRSKFGSRQTSVESGMDAWRISNRRRLVLTRSLSLALFLSSLSVFSGCSKQTSTASDPAVPSSIRNWEKGDPAQGLPPKNTPPQVTAPEVKAPVLESPISKGESQIVSLPNGAEIVVMNVAGRPYFQVEGVWTDQEHQLMKGKTSGLSSIERRAWFEKELSQVQEPIKAAGGWIQDSVPELGYFSVFVPYDGGRGLMERLKGLRFARNVILSPVVMDRGSLKQLHDLRPEEEGLVRVSKGGRSDNRDFSGLSRIGESEFVRIAEEAIGGGVKVDGSSVKLGITDTGVTYGHPSFEDATGKSRVDYMRDFTGEGRVYFRLDQKLEVSAVEGQEDELNLNTKVILTPKLPLSPAADELADLKGLRIKVGPELKAMLLNEQTSVKLGILQESNFQKAPTEDDPAGEFADLNRNGKLDDKFYALLIPGATPAEDKVYFDSSGTGDFRNVRPLGDFNRTKATTTVFAETVGFDLRELRLPLKSGEGSAPVRSLSVVGYDPGNHGTHVAGIAAGRKTIANDREDTLARGVAPNARIYMNRVCSNNAGCTATRAAIDLVMNGNVDLVNQSLGGLSPFNDGNSAEEVTVNRLIAEKNAMFIISAGNSGPGRQTVGSPSTSRHALSVGATATRGMIERQYQYPGLGASDEGGLGLPALDADFMLFFSSRGPSAAGGFKPNLVAPGTELSAVQINSAPGTRAGLDVYWGTSMAAPTASGAYALLLDGVRKYNAAHPDRKLSEDALEIRRVLLESARPFDVNRTDLASGERSTGQYTWIDQGKGMINLPQAWRALIALRDSGLPSAVVYQGQNVELDYTVLVSMSKNPNGAAYDGSRAGGESDSKQPVFGNGLYLNYFSTQSMAHVSIKRDLPPRLQGVAEAGELFRRLATTSDEFELKTVIYGSDKPWIRAGVLGRLGAPTCEGLEERPLQVVGRGVDIDVGENGTGSLGQLLASTLSVCIDRKVVNEELSPGDHGAMIEAYRVVDGKRASAASFRVPVYLAVPHQVLADKTGFDVSGSVRSFGVNRHYVTIPEGATSVRVSLEVPELKRNRRGALEAGEHCSGVELMALVGGNTLKPFKKRAQARVVNCLENGEIAQASKRRIEWVTSEPKAGTWDLHIFGAYRNALSKYKLRVDYVAAEVDRKKIEGGLAALAGEVRLSINSASSAVAPSERESKLELQGLVSERARKSSKGSQEFVPAPGASPAPVSTGAPEPSAPPTAGPAADSPQSLFRVYLDDVDSVTVETGDSTGNDIDLAVVKCPMDVSNPEDEKCSVAGRSEGSTDVESVTFKPERGQKYAVQVMGYDIKDEGNYRLTELLGLKKETYDVSIHAVGAPEASMVAQFAAKYQVSAEQQAVSQLVKHAWFVAGKFDLAGALAIRTETGQVLAQVPLRIGR